LWAAVGVVTTEAGFRSPWRLAAPIGVIALAIVTITGNEHITSRGVNGATAICLSLSR